MSATKRIVCYAINGSGLGHLTRLTAVARWMRRYVSLLDNCTPEVIFLTSSDASDALAEAGFAAFKIPSKTVAKRAQLDKLEYRRLAKHFVWNTLGVFAPDLLVVDTFPSGSFDELFQVLDGPFKKGFIYRDVKPEYAARPTFRSALGLYDTIAAPHQPAHVENRDAARIDNVFENADVAYCGEVVQFEREELIPRAIARRQLGVADVDRVVYLSAGGGGDPAAESTLVALVEALRAEPCIHLLVGAGPLYRGSRLSGPNVTWFESPRVWQYFSAVDAALSAAGYNTFHELLFARVPTAFYSQSKIADDQSRRITLAASVQACRHLSDVNDAPAITQTVRELLHEPTASKLRQGCEQFLNENGARTCALELLRPLYPDSQLHWAASVMTPSITFALERIDNGVCRTASNWLTTLVPHGQMRNVATHPGLTHLIGRLSPSAAKEVHALLADADQLADLNTFEQHLVRLVDSIVAANEVATPTTNVRFLADEVLKTLSVAIKKQPLEAARNGNYTRWICMVIQRVESLLQFPSDKISVSDVMQLCRVFPRIVDATTEEAFDLFITFLEDQRARHASTHEVLRQLQVIKLTHAKMTMATMQEMLESESASR